MYGVTCSSNGSSEKKGEASFNDVKGGGNPKWKLDFGILPISKPETKKQFPKECRY